MKPFGKRLIKSRKTYTYSTSTTDPNGDQVKYCFSWDDGTVTWTDLVDSGETVYVEHSWDKVGIYDISVKAVDETGLESEWSVFLEIGVIPQQSTSQQDNQNNQQNSQNQGQNMQQGTQGSSSDN